MGKPHVVVLASRGGQVTGPTWQDGRIRTRLLKFQVDRHGKGHPVYDWNHPISRATYLDRMSWCMPLAWVVKA